MSTTTTRRRFLKRAGGAIGAAGAAGAALPSRAAAAMSLDASFSAAHPPYPAIRYPSSWFARAGQIGNVVMPHNIVVCNRDVGPLTHVHGGPDLRGVPGDVALLVIWLWDPVPSASVTNNGISQAIPLSKGRTMRFSELGGGQPNWLNFRVFTGWYVARAGDSLYSIEVDVSVGPNAGTEWNAMQPIVDSIEIGL